MPLPGRPTRLSPEPDRTGGGRAGGAWAADRAAGKRHPADRLRGVAAAGPALSVVSCRSRPSRLRRGAPARDVARPPLAGEDLKTVAPTATSSGSNWTRCPSALLACPHVTAEDL